MVSWIYPRYIHSQKKHDTVRNYMFGGYWQSMQVCIYIYTCICMHGHALCHFKVWYLRTVMICPWRNQVERLSDQDFALPTLIWAEPNTKLFRSDLKTHVQYLCIFFSVTQSWLEHRLVKLQFSYWMNWWKAQCFYIILQLFLLAPKANVCGLCLGDSGSLNPYFDIGNLIHCWRHPGWFQSPFLFKLVGYLLNYYVMPSTWFCIVATFMVCKQSAHNKSSQDHLKSFIPVY